MKMNLWVRELQSKSDLGELAFCMQGSTWSQHFLQQPRTITFEGFCSVLQYNHHESYFLLDRQYLPYKQIWKYNAVMIFVQPFVCIWRFAHWSDVYFQFIFMHFFRLNWHKRSSNDKRVTTDQREQDWQRGLETTCIVREPAEFYWVWWVSVYPQKLTKGNKEKLPNSWFRISAWVTGSLIKSPNLHFL